MSSAVLCRVLLSLERLIMGPALIAFGHDFSAGECMMAALACSPFRPSSFGVLEVIKRGRNLAANLFACQYMCAVMLPP